MKYIYMDNFRGFKNILIPLAQTNFLVGENSTGKSSFLKLLHILSTGQFWFLPEDVLHNSELGGFKDMVSATATDKSYFKVGVIEIKEDIDEENKTNCEFRIATFIEKEGLPSLSRYIDFSQGELSKLVFQNKITKYKNYAFSWKDECEEEWIAFFKKTLEKDINDTRGFTKFTHGMPSFLPIGVYLTQIKSKEAGRESAAFFFNSNFTNIGHFTWIAPIRTKPERFYGGLKRNFSPEGEHVPYVLRQSLNLKTKNTIFAKKIRAFGEASGLFETISAHSFAKTPHSPFELLIKFSDAELSINNVGYGISQALPLIVEFLSAENRKTFAVQQPEVHLHPRAQAALGSLIYELGKENKHEFVLETHSEYLIDRFRLCVSQDKTESNAQIIFFERTENGNIAYPLLIDKDGRYPIEQPQKFRDFFIKEEMSLLEI